MYAAFRQATLHPKNTCDYCWGARSRVFPDGKIDRYYPNDTNWNDMRSIVSPSTASFSLTACSNSFSAFSFVV